MNNFWTELAKPILVLAPMAGITDQPFRLLCKKFGADVLYSEMVSTEAIFYNNLKSKILNLKSTTKNSKLSNSHPSTSLGASKLKANSLLKTLNLIRFCQLERPFIVQIFGSDPAKMAFAAEYISSGEWQRDYAEILNSKLETLNKSPRKADPLYADKIQNKKIQNYFEIGRFEFNNYLKVGHNSHIL